jgi:hypothetical protein
MQMLGLRFKLLKLIVKRKQKKRRNQPLSQTDQHLIIISKNVIRNRNSKLFYFPNSGDRYVINEALGLTIIMKDNRIDICNHSYHYILDMRPDAMEDIVRLHNRELECTKREMDRGLGRNVNDSLSKLLLFTEVN